jgi:hypothetical protein
MSSEIFINITKEKKEMTNVQLENEIDCKNETTDVHVWNVLENRSAYAIMTVFKQGWGCQILKRGKPPINQLERDRNVIR